MERRTFVGLLLVTATTGCIHGSSEEKTEEEPPEQAEFGLTGWVPSGRYATLTYLDYSVMRQHTSLSFDNSALSPVSGLALEYSDIEEVTSGRKVGDGGFEAYLGSFDRDSVTESASDALENPEREDLNGYSILRRGDTGNGEIAISDTSIIVGTGESPTDIIETSFGEGTKHSETDDFLADAPQFAQDPFAVTIDYTVGIYRILDDRGDHTSYVEVPEYRTEQRAKEAYKGYSVPENDSFTEIERVGRKVSIATREDGSGIQGLLDAGQFPRWNPSAEENKI